MNFCQSLRKCLGVLIVQICTTEVEATSTDIKNLYYEPPLTNSKFNPNFLESVYIDSNASTSISENPW